MKNKDLVDAFRVAKPDKFRLADCDPADTGHSRLDKDEGKALLGESLKKLNDLQERLYAEGRWAVLVVLQAMDAAGKDSAIEHVMSGINPQGCSVHSFKAPSSLELAHDFLWRAVVNLPARGYIGIFNRSYYEEMLVVRVHPEILARQKLPPDLVTKHIWDERFDDVRAFERHLGRNGVLVLKFFLNVSKDEQRRRFLARLDEPDKRWKFELADVEERKLWDKYMAAYEDMIRNTSTDEAPWHVVPADHKWFARLVISRTIVEAMEKLKPKFPDSDPEVLKRMKQVRQALLDEK